MMNCMDRAANKAFFLKTANLKQDTSMIFVEVLARSTFLEVWSYTVISIPVQTRLTV